ncbi:hypothetical protein FAGKG844_20168 [Frankia sp. AgKG'84/4]
MAALLVGQRTGERDQRAAVRQTLVIDVPADRLVQVERLLPAVGDDHRLRPAAEAAGDVRVEVLDDQLRLLRRRLRMRLDELDELAPRLLLLDLRVGDLRVLLRDGVAGQPPHRIVGQVVRQDVEDVALVDRLLHRVHVERHVQRLAVLVQTVRVEGAEKLQRGGRGSGGESEVRQVRLPAADPGQVGRLVLVGLPLRLRADRLLELRGLLTGLRRVRLVDDHRKTLRAETLARDLVEDERVLLQRRDDDLRRRVRQRGRELTRILVDLLDDPGRVVELVDRVLELLVEHEPVGDDDDLVEHLLVVHVEQGRQAVRQPGDRVRLARACRVLHQVVLAGAVLLGVANHRLDGVPLVVAREDPSPLVDAPLRALLLVLGVDVHEPLQHLQPVVPTPDLLPQVGDPIGAFPGLRVAGGSRLPRAVGAQIERQEPGVGARQPGRDERPVRIDGEVHQGTLREEQLLRIPPPVLRDRILGCLPGHPILQLDGRHRQPVHEQRQVDGLVRILRAETKLPGRGQNVGVVLLERVDRQRVPRPEVRQLNLHPPIPHPLPQNVQHPPLVDLRRHPLAELPMGKLLGTVELNKPIPALLLRRPDKPNQLSSIQPKPSIKPKRGLPRLPPMTMQFLLDPSLKGMLRMHPRRHAAPSSSRPVATSSRPVTAAVITA